MHSAWPQTQFLGGGCASCSHFPGNGITSTVKHFGVALKAGEMARLLALLSLAEYWSSVLSTHTGSSQPHGCPWIVTATCASTHRETYTHKNKGNICLKTN